MSLPGYRGKDARRLPGPLLGRWLVLACLASALCLSSGCVTTGPLDYVRNGFKVGPDYCRPPAPVAEQWIQAKDPGVQDRHLQDWWQVFQDAALNSLIDTAYAQNLTLRVAGTRVLEARAQQAIAVGNIFPQTQQTTGSYARVNLGSNFPLMGPILQLFPPGQRSAAFSNWFYGFNLSWELD